MYTYPKHNVKNIPWNAWNKNKKKKTKKKNKSHLIKLGW